MKLLEMFVSQDMGTKGVDKICQSLLDGKFNSQDAVSEVIINAWRDNGGQENEFNPEGAISDLRYAAGQLQKSIDAIKVKYPS